MNERLKLDEFITHRFDLPQLNEAIEVLHHGECLRCVLKVSE
jgi:S-(hydroxymethyl)glutathione dehydrogenase/alcohol dehydrogenase